MNVRTLIGESVPPGRGFPVSQGLRPLRRRSATRRDAARGGAAQPRGAWPHPQDRRVSGACHAGRACGHHGGGYRRNVPIIPLRLANLPEFKSYLQPVIACGKVRYVGEPVAVVVAETQGQAEDALEAIELGIERLPHCRTGISRRRTSLCCLTARRLRSHQCALQGTIWRCLTAAFAKAKYYPKRKVACHG